MTWYSNPHLFHIFYNAHKRTTFDGLDFCYFVWEHEPYIEPSYEELPLRKWVKEQEQKEKEHWETHQQQQKQQQQQEEKKEEKEKEKEEEGKSIQDQEKAK